MLRNHLNNKIPNNFVSGLIQPNSFVTKKFQTNGFINLCCGSAMNFSCGLEKRNKLLVERLPGVGQFAYN